MASLDDFFAKKDKKKSKKKQYKAASSLIDPTAQPTNDPAPAVAEETEKPKKGAKGRIAEYNDDTWAESFEEEKVPDFSGLKIATKVVAKEEESVAAAPEPEEAAPESDDEADTATAETVDWATGEVRQQEEAKPDPMMPNVSGGTYVPPRNRASVGGPRRGSSRQQAPDLGTMSFPTLGAAVADSKITKERGADEFQQVGPGQGARVSSNPNRYQPPAARGQSNGYAGLDRRGNDGYGRDRW